MGQEVRISGQWEYVPHSEEDASWFQGFQQEMKECYILYGIIVLDTLRSYQKGKVRSRGGGSRLLQRSREVIIIGVTPDLSTC